jgi:hypothetical protein
MPFSKHHANASHARFKKGRTLVLVRALNKIMRILFTEPALTPGFNST